jgi:hypothetical protein
MEGRVPFPLAVIKPCIVKFSPADAGVGSPSGFKWVLAVRSETGALLPKAEEQIAERKGALADAIGIGGDLFP